VEYSRALSLKRRATFRFNLAPSVLNIPSTALIAATAQLGEVETPVGSVVDGRLYRLQGEASVTYEFPRRWRATANYHRATEYLALLTEPVFADGSRVDIVGLITSRVDVAAAAGYATAASAIHRRSQDLETRTGDVRFRFALNRTVALYAQYLYYYYDLRGQAHLAPGLPNVFEQHGIRLGLMLFKGTLGR
jgi:hypothetical protein